MAISDDMRAVAPEAEAQQMPRLTLAGREALRKRSLAAVLEMQSVIFEANGLTPSKDVDALPFEARSLIADLACVAHRAREMIGGQN